MDWGRFRAADSRRFSAMEGIRWRLVLMRWAWTWLSSLIVLHCWSISVLGFSGKWGMVVMAVAVWAGKVGRVKVILFCFQVPQARKPSIIN